MGMLRTTFPFWTLGWIVIKSQGRGADQSISCEADADPGCYAVALSRFHAVAGVKHFPLSWRTVVMPFHRRVYMLIPMLVVC